MMEEILAQLDPKLRKRLQLASDLDAPEYAALPSISLSNALGGGFRYGRQHMVYGNKSSGKSSLLLQMIGMEQAKGRTAAWIDAEESMDESWAKRLGVDTSKLIVSDSRSINDMVDDGTKLIKAGVDILIVDSISSLLPAVFFEKDSDDMKDLVNTKQIGAEARDMAHAVKMLNYANNQGNKALIVLISQTRNAIGGLYASIIPTGGKAVQFYSSTIVQLFSSESDKQALKGRLQVGNRIIERNIGRKVNWSVKFSKTSPAFRDGEYDFYYDGPLVGVDVTGDLVSMGIMLGAIAKAGSWFTFGEKRFQGKDDLIKGIRSSDELSARLAVAVNELLEN